MMFPFSLLVLSIVCIAINYFRDSRPRTFRLFTEVSLRFLVLINTGFGGILAFMGHAFNPDGIARNIGWETGSPFQFEVAAANLAFGIVGIASFWIGGTFRIAAVTANAVFLLGCGYGHLRDILLHGNTSPLNAGAVLWISDIFFPLVLLLLALLDFKRLNRASFIR
ncbi:MAG: DUF6790 family protein [Syntrophales bacterium]